MNLINFLLMEVASLALYPAIGASVLLIILPFFYIATRGQAIKRTSGRGGTSRWMKLWRFAIVLGVPLVVMLWASIAGRELTINRAGILDEAFAIRLSLLMSMATLGGWLLMFLITRPSSPLSEGLSLLMGGVKRRTDELGSAHFADRLEYRRFAEKHTNGITLLGECTSSKTFGHERLFAKGDFVNIFTPQ